MRKFDRELSARSDRKPPAPRDPHFSSRSEQLRRGTSMKIDKQL